MASLTTATVAGELGISVRRLEDWIKKEHLKAELMGRTYIIAEREFKRRRPALERLAERGRGRPPKAGNGKPPKRD